MNTYPFHFVAKLPTAGIGVSARNIAENRFGKRVSNFSSSSARREGENLREIAGMIDSRKLTILATQFVTRDVSRWIGTVRWRVTTEWIRENNRGASRRPATPSLPARRRPVAGYGRTERRIPGVVLLLEIPAGLDIRGRRFGHVGCRFAAILTLLAHPVGHLIRQAGEHRHCDVRRRARLKSAPFSFFLTSSPRSNDDDDDDDSRLRIRRNRTGNVTEALAGPEW